MVYDNASVLPFVHIIRRRWVRVCRSQPPILRRERRQSFPSYPHSSPNTIAFTIPIASILFHFHDSAYHPSSPAPSPPFPSVLPPFSLLTSHHFLYPLTPHLLPAPLSVSLTPLHPLPSSPLPNPHPTHHHLLDRISKAVEPQGEDARAPVPLLPRHLLLPCRPLVTPP